MSILRTPRIAAILAEERRSRRGFLIGSAKVVAGGTLAAVLAGRVMPAAFAQGTPATLNGLNYPELKVTITDKEFELSTDSVPAGYVLLTVTNNTKDDIGAAVLGPPPGKTMQDLMQLASTPPASPGGFPPFLYQATIAGGPGDPGPGGTAQAIIKLDAGDWVVFGEGNQPPAPLTATAGTPASAQEPTAAFTLIEQDMLFVGFDKPISPGQQLWKVVNQGKQPHMLVLGQVPASTTIDQLKEALTRPENATPPPGGLKESDLQYKGGVLLQSTGTTVWPLLDLPAGRYAALCFVTDPKTGMPHAMEGMASIFNIGAAGTPAP